MAPLKRKRKPTRTTANKRPKYTQPDTESSSSCNSSSEEEGDNHDSQIEWEALRILEQKGHGFGLQYLIAWKGIDPATGEQWSPTWERFSNASESLRASWKEERARRLLENTDGVNSAQHHGFPEAPQVQAVQTRASRRRRIVESYEIPTSASSINSPTEDNRPAVTAPSTVTLDIDASTSVWTPSQANIDSRGNISSRSESELPTEIPESLPSSPKRVAEETDFGSSPLFASEHTFHASGIVPDTQSSIGDTSYIPVTQEELDSSLHSDTTDKSTEGNIVENSSFFDADAPPRLGARAQSPATSIAETVADTTQDLQSQRQLESQQEQLELPETLGSPAASTRSGYRVTQNDRSSQHTDFVTARPRSPFNQHKSTSPDRTLFVENTTHLDHEASSNHLQTFSRGQDRSSTSEVLQRDLSSTYERPVASLAFSEALVVADTPQISQLTSTAQEGATNEDQTDAAPQAEISQQSVDETDPTSLTEYSVLEENAQFPFHSQYSAFFDIRSIKPTEQASANPVRSSSTTDFAEVRLSEELSSSLHQERSAYNESEESTTIDEISQSPLPQGPHLLAHADSQNSCQLSPTIEQSTDSREYNAQCVHSSARLSTQDDTIESLKDTVEVEPGARASPQQRSSPFSRHDSSQETPERHLQSGECSSSIPHPPSYSLRTLDSNVPPRPATPIPGSSLSKMTETSGGGADLPESTAAKIDRQLRELQEADRLANPYTPRRQRTRVFRPPSTASATVDATGPVSQLKNEPAPPVIHISAEGTRSPSTVPDRSPAPPAPTSLRTVALANAKERATEILPEKVLAAAVTTTEGEPAQARVDLFAAEAGAPTKQVGSPRALALDTTGERSDVEDHDDVSDDESFYDDSLELEHNEFVVPLFIEGRQKDTYTAYIDRNKTLLNNVVFQLEDSVSIESELLESAENLLTYMKAVETHPDLIYAEAESATRFETQSATDVQHGAQFGIENSVKFKFLHELFNHLREEHVHVVLLLDQENDALLNILMNSFAAASLDFKMPTKGYQSHASDDALTITIFPSVASLVLRPADLTICLDGVQSAAKIRESNWAMASGKPVPVLHLVIPQTAGHIERYIPATKKKTNRIWTILNGLAQISRRFELGKPIDEETPKAAEAARLIASWLLAEDDGPQTEWPLPSIGNASFLDDDESQDYVASVTTSPAPERTKRPLEADESDTAKRMRYAPQSLVASNSSATRQHDATRVSDSMPGTAVSESARLLARLDEAHSELLRVETEHREKEVMWDRQQTEHENRAQDYRKLFNEKAEVDRAHESMTKNRDKLRTQLEVQTTELRAIKDELEAQRILTFQSVDEKDVEITRLRKELEIANLERDKALKSEKSTEQTLEYTKEQYRIVQNTAIQLQTDLTSLETQNAKLTHQASGEVAKLKQIHFDKSAKNLIQQNRVLMNEVSRLKTILKQKEDELVRAKANGGRAAYGTRGQSTTPQPKTRSRAGSPIRRLDRLRQEER